MSNSNILKVFCSGEMREQVIAQHGHIADYDAFVLVEVDAQAAGQIKAEHPTEDITDLFQIQTGVDTIDTSLPRVTEQGGARKHPAYAGVKKLATGPHHYLVQFVGPIKHAWLRRVKRLGAEPRRPHSDFTYVVRSDEATLREIAALPFVRWVGHLSHRNRVFSKVAADEGKLPRSKFLPGAHTVAFFDADDMTAGLPALKQLGIRILSTSRRACTATIELSGSEYEQQRLLQEVSAIHGVSSIRNLSVKRTSNDVGTGLMQADTSWLEAQGLTGAGEIIAVCDTGLDSGNASTIHADFQGRIEAIKSYPINSLYNNYINNPGGDDGAADLDSGHGTHVAGSVLGSGASSQNLPSQAALIRGISHQARIVFQAVEQELQWKDYAYELEYGRYLLAGIPDDLTSLFSYAYTKGARIHSNSWGGGDPGAYDSQCYDLDEFVWKKKDFLVLAAAGNDGTDFDGDGTINPMSVTSPATAKNCLTVGASESLRVQFNHARYGTWWPQDYPVDPFHSDPMADDGDQVVAFSSRGPTLDGRVKPDVVAPGTFILSTRSAKLSPSNKAWAAFPPSNMYFYMGGTSMATPLVAGAAGVLRQFLRTWVGYQSPSAALIKACLIMSARQLPGTASSGMGPDNEQGFGLVEVASIIDPDPPNVVLFVDQPHGVHTGQQQFVDLNVSSSAVPLEVVMVYSDYPGDHLINNLNLLLEDPNGQLHLGNANSGSMSPDTVNNVERVSIPSPMVGTWKLRIIGSNVPHGPQDFALVIRGAAS